MNLSTQTVESNVRLGPNEHGNGDYEEILMVEKNALADDKVKAELAKLQLPEGTVVCADPWIYGSDGKVSSPLVYSLKLFVRQSVSVDSRHPC